VQLSWIFATNAVIGRGVTVRFVAAFPRYRAREVLINLAILRSIPGISVPGETKGTQTELTGGSLPLNLLRTIMSLKVRRDETIAS